MGKRNKTHTPGVSYRYLTVFFVGILILLIISSLLKVLEAIAKSQFDGHNRFTIAFCCKENTAQIISLSPDESSGSLLYVHNTQRISDKLIAIHLDHVVKTHSIDLTTHSLSSVIFHQLLTRNTDSISWYDTVRMYLFAQSLRENNIAFKEISLPQPDEKVDSIVSALFKDNKINIENKSIQIINASDTPGIGNRLARVLLNMGGNVVSVVTASTPQKISLIAYKGGINYTIKKVQKILQYKLIEGNSPSISDITISIGKDNTFTNF